MVMQVGVVYEREEMLRRVGRVTKRVPSVGPRKVCWLRSRSDFR
jgi:hypothetical protein